jgi:hypothetical protein
MSLFKALRGNRTALAAVEKHNGYVYFCTDDGSLFFDYLDENNVLQRKQINAANAETLTGLTLEEIKQSISWNDLQDKPNIEEMISSQLGGLRFLLNENGILTISTKED